MPSGKELESKAKDAESNGLDENIIAGNYYDAMKQYEKEGNNDKANECRKKTESFIQKSSPAWRGEFMDQLEKEAEKIEKQAKNAPKAEGEKGSTELFPKAVYLRVKAAYWAEMGADLAHNAKNYHDAAEGYSEAAAQKAQAAKDLEDAAEKEPKKDSKEVKQELSDASYLRHDSGSLHKLAAKSFGKSGESDKQTEEQKAADTEESKSVTDKNKAK